MKANLILNFFRYPAGYINLLAVIFTISEIYCGKLTKEDAYKISWSFSKIIIAVLPVMIFIICYSSGSYLFGIIASISATFSEILIQYSKVSIVDIPLTTFSLLFFTISVYYLKRSELSFRKLIVLSIIIGVSIAMKYTGALLVLPLFLIINKFLHQNKNSLEQNIFK